MEPLHASELIRLTDSAQTLARLVDDPCIGADPQLRELFDVGVTHLVCVEEVLPAASSLVRKLKRFGRMCQELSLEEFDSALPDVITGLQRHHASAKAAQELSQGLLISLERFRQRSAKAQSQREQQRRKAQQDSTHHAARSWGYGAGAVVLGGAGVLGLPFLGLAGFVLTGARLMLGAGAVGAAHEAYEQRSAAEAAAQLAAVKGSQAVVVSQLTTSFQALDATLASVSKFFLDTHHDLAEALESSQEAEEEVGGFVMLRAVKDSFITLKAISASLIQNCDTYQSAARQCQEQLQDLRLRAGGRVKQDMVVEWRREHMLQLHVAGHSPVAPDLGLLRLTA
ncbi:hypothetical protein N2152v2_001135 [Parachlorella kessleri]